MQTLNQNQAGERTQIKAGDIKTEWGRLVAGFDDTVNGEKVTAGSFEMGSNAATAKVVREGKEYTLEIVHGFNGSIYVSANGRRFCLDLNTFLDHAIASGLLNPAPMNFPAVD